MHEAERAWLSERFPLSLAEVKANLLKQPCSFPQAFDPSAYRLFHGEPTRLLHDGDTLDLGGRAVTVIHTPGHSPGHCCFYEPARQYLYTGDLLYRGTLYANFPSTDPQAFFTSLKRLQAYEIHRLLPGHHDLNIPVSLLLEAAEGFAAIARSDKLHHGGGTFSFEHITVCL